MSRNNNKLALGTLFFIIAIIGIFYLLEYISKPTPVDDKVFQKENATFDWPLEALDFNDRENGISNFLRTQNLSFEPSLSNASEDECLQVFDSLKKHNFEILKPKYVFKKTMKDENVILKNCPNLNIDTISFGQSNTDFYKSRSVHNREYYDLTKYLGDGHWGFFAEGGVIECSNNSQSICDNRKGYNSFLGTVGSIYNLNNCQVLLGPDFNVEQRISSYPQDPHKYKKNNSKYAFISLENRVFRLALSSENKSNGDDKDEGASLILDTPETKKYCSYLSEDLKEFFEGYKNE